MNLITKGIEALIALLQRVSDALDNSDLKTAHDELKDAGPLLEQIFPRPNYDDPVKDLPMNTEYRWDTKEGARHSVRMICDEMLPLKKTAMVDGKKYYPKDLITAVIHAESAFNNNAKNYNKNKAGKITSTDWGICQINDTKGWHIGPGLAFPSVDYVLKNPEKAVRYMIRMYNVGKITLWSAYKNGSFKRYLPK